VSVSIKHTPVDGGAEIAIPLASSEVGQWWHDLEISAELMDTLLWALGMLRSGINVRAVPALPPQVGDWLGVISDLHRLQKRVEGAQIAAVRAYVEMGGDHSRLGTVIGVDAHHAETLVRELERSEPGVMEIWARASGAQAV
jgi:hypothetical protein